MEYVPNKNRWYPEHRDDFESIGAINVVLPVQIEQRLLNLEPGNPMRLMIEHLHANGVDAVYIQQYIDAAASLHADRPSRVGRSRDYNFLPPASYFRPELNFANHAAANWLSDPFPAGSILSRFKPRVTSFDQGALQIEEPPAYKAIMAEVQEVISSEDQRIVESLKDFFEQDPRLEESRDSLLRILNADGVDLRYNDVMDIINDQELAFDVLNQIDDIFLGNVAKGDIFLSRINRLMYSLHEPMHIVEAVNYGDALIRIKERLNADELAVLNEEAEKEAIRRTELGLDNLGKEAEARRQKTWFFRTRKDDTGPSLHRSFVFENEALMDSLS